MSQALIEQVEADYMKKDGVPQVNVGDTVDVHTRIIEGDKQRVQVFGGVVIARKGRGINATITVRRIVANQGVERVFPLHSPKVADITIKRQGHVRRGKLYYLRDRVGKARRLRDRRRGLGTPGADSTRKQSARHAQSEDAARQVAESSAPAQEEAGRKGTD